MQPGDPEPKTQAYPPSGGNSSSGGNAGMGVGLYAILLIGGALAFGAYKYLDASKDK